MPYILNVNPTSAIFDSVIVVTLSTNRYFANRTVTFSSSSGIDSMGYVYSAGIFLYSNSPTYTTTFDNNGNAKAFLLDTISHQSNLPRSDYINIKYLGGAYSINDTVRFY